VVFKGLYCLVKQQTEKFINNIGLRIHMKCKSYETFFVNFSNKSKLNIITALRNEPLNVKTITKKINEEQSAVSHNLKKLSACHVLDVKKAGKERIYSLNKDTVIPILRLVEKHVIKNCSGSCCKK